MPPPTDLIRTPRSASIDLVRAPMVDARSGPDSVSRAIVPPGALRPFPVLSSTQFCLELMDCGSTLDLSRVVDLLSRDPGAVLRLFTLVAREFPDPEDRPVRLEDCITSVPGRELLNAMHDPPACRKEQAALVSFARHGHTIALYASASAVSIGLSAEAAFLVGLFHALGTLPVDLGRPSIGSGAHRPDLLLAAMAPHLHLPPKLQAALEAVHRTDAGSVWVALIQAAHDLAASATPPLATQPFGLRRRMLP